MDLFLKHIIITGGSSGIGKALAKLLAKQGANLTIIARDKGKLHKAQQEINSNCISKEQIILILSADVSQQEEITTAIETATQKLGTPQILITSAGFAHPDYFTNLTTDIFTKTMAVNYFGTLYCLQTIVPMMKQQKQGQIVIISSGAGLTGIFGYTAYSSSKFALRGLAESLRAELKPHNINLSIVYPPDTDTPQLEYENQTKPPATKEITATAEVWKPEEVAKVIFQGIKKQKFMITPGLEMSILAKFHSLLQPLLNYYFDKIIQKNLINKNVN